jgi:hypothetical protein
MKTSRRVIGIVALSVVGLGLLIWSAIGNHYQVDLSDSRTFTIEMPFVPLRKILVQTDAAKQIMNAGEHSKLISKTTLRQEGHIDDLLAPFQSWEGSQRNALMVQINDSYIGKRKAAFTQNVSVTPGSIHSVISLNKAEGPLLGYTVTTNISGDGNTSTFETALQMKIDTPAPWFAHWFARMRVRSAIRRTLRAQEAQIKAAVEKHRGQF